jgi:hypothetical protein
MRSIQSPQFYVSGKVGFHLAPSIGSHRCTIQGMGRNDAVGAHLAYLPETQVDFWEATRLDCIFGSIPRNVVVFLAYWYAWTFGHCRSPTQHPASQS